MLPTCFSTVPSVTQRRLAIPAFERVDVRHPTLQEITHPRTRAQKVRGVLHIDVRGQDQDPEVRVLLPHHPGCVQALRRVRRWHPDVDDGDIRHERSHEREQLVSVTGLTHDLEA